MQIRLVLDTHSAADLAADNAQWKDGSGGHIEKTLLVCQNPPTSELKCQLNLARERVSWLAFLAMHEGDPDAVVGKIWAPSKVTTTSSYSKSSLI